MTPELKPYPFDFKTRTHARPNAASIETHPVVIVGGGVAGLTAALALAAQGVKSVVIEADDTVCYGSRAICISRRSLEIFDRVNAADAILAKGLAWTGGRSFYRDEEVLHFSMPHDENQKLPPMVNIQQYYLEEYLVQQAEQQPEAIDLRWGSKVTQAQADDQGVRLQIQGPNETYTIQADWVVATDGGRSFMRETLGLALQGTAYEGRYVVADIELDSSLPTERLAWFNPPSNPGSTILMHKQPDNVWRIDYQLRDGEDPDAAIRPENVWPRVQAHLEMIGETGPWKPLWITIYKANALTLERYRHGRVLFAGDAAHLVPIFGVRGANSAIDDADNLAWKLAYVVRGLADASLLDTYSEERVFAAHENLASGMKSTEFMAPPTFAFKLMREAVLNLAVDTPAIRSLINPRQTSTISYRQSVLNAASSDEAAFASGPPPGTVLSSAALLLLGPAAAEQPVHLTDTVRPGEFLILHFSENGEVAEEVGVAARHLNDAGIPLRLVCIARRRPNTIQGETETLLDADGTAFSLYDASPAASYLVRPDGHVAGRWRSPTATVIEQAVRAVLHPSTSQQSKP